MVMGSETYARRLSWRRIVHRVTGWTIIIVAVLAVPHAHGYQYFMILLGVPMALLVINQIYSKWH
jgi:hypothetical protein